MKKDVIEYCPPALKFALVYVDGSRILTLSRGNTTEEMEEEDYTRG